MFKRKVNAVLFSMVMFFVVVAGTVFGENVPANTFSMKLGKFEVVALHDTDMEMDAALFKNADPEVLKKYMPDGKISASANAYVVKTGKKTVLIDSGNGDGIFGKGQMLEHMLQAGINPKDIDIILITHAHSDHVGGLVKDGKAAFPKERKKKA
jgi:metal-dependent hydrolase (beta-lactamase superfamily II)